MTRAASELTLDEVWDYARCPYRHFWRHQARIAPPPTARGLVEEHMRLALSLYYSGSENRPAEDSKQVDLMACLGSAWRATIEGWGAGHGMWTLLVEFAAVRARVSELSFNAQASDSDGAGVRATVPDAQPRSRGGHGPSASEAHLPELAMELKERLSGAPVLVSEDYGVAEALADSVEIVQRNRWPDPGEIAGIGFPYVVELLGGRRLEATADLVRRAGDGAVTVEVHEYDRSDSLPLALLRRDLRVVAALHGQGEGWAEVRDVVYRDVQLGKAVRISRGPSSGRLLAAVIGAEAGIRHQVYVPRLAVEPRECQSCSFLALCTNGHDILDTMDATLLGAVRR